MLRCVKSEPEVELSPSGTLKTLLSTLVTVAKVEGNDEKWQYCFYNVVVPPRSSANIRVVSSTKLSGVYRDGFSLGLGQKLTIEELHKYSGIEFSSYEDIGPLAIGRTTLSQRNQPRMMSYIIRMLEVHGLHIDDLIPVLEALDAVSLEGTAQTNGDLEFTSLEKLCAKRRTRGLIDCMARDRKKKMYEACRMKLDTMLTKARPGERLPLDNWCKHIASLGQVGLGHLRECLLAPHPCTFGEVRKFGAIRLNAMGLLATSKSEAGRAIRIPLREMTLPLCADQAAYVEDLLQGSAELSPADNRSA